MGVKERQEREREAVSRAILDAARDLFVAEGYPHVSIRKIAERIEYSPAAIYGYFPSKDDIFFALAQPRMPLERVHDAVEQRLPAEVVVDPSERKPELQPVLRRRVEQLRHRHELLVHAHGGPDRVVAHEGHTRTRDLRPRVQPAVGRACYPAAADPTARSGTRACHPPAGTRSPHRPTSSSSATCTRSSARRHRSAQLPRPNHARRVRGGRRCAPLSLPACR